MPAAVTAADADADADARNSTPWSIGPGTLRDRAGTARPGPGHQADHVRATPGQGDSPQVRPRRPPDQGAETITKCGSGQMEPSEPADRGHWQPPPRLRR